MSKQSSRIVVAVVVACAAVAALTGFARPTPGTAPATFRTADGSAACAALASGAVACRTRGASHSQVLHPDGRSEATALAVAWTSRTPVLLGAESWWRGNAVCRAAGARIRCSSGSGTIALAARQ